MENEEALLLYVKAHDEIPIGAGELVLALFEYRPSRHATPVMIANAVKRGALKMAEVVQWLAERLSCNRSIDLIGMWPRIPADQALAVAALRKLLEQLLTDYRSFHEGIHGKCKRVLEVLIGLSRTDADNEAIRESLAAALNTERQRSDRNHWFAQPLMNWLAKFGDADTFQIEDVEPWEGMLIHWKANGYSWTDAITGLTAAGAIDPVSAEALSKWPGPDARSHAVDTFMSLPGLERGRLAFAVGLRDEDPYDQLFTSMGRVLRPAVEIQTTWDEKEFRLLRYTCQGVERLLQFEDPGYILNHVASVGREFNNLMREFKRPERAFMMIEAPHWENDAAVFLCADAQRFLEVRDRLRLPFMRPEDHRWIT
mgnify:FL=1